MEMLTLAKGTTLYHGTCASFDESVECLEGPAWVSRSLCVARYFAQRSGACKRLCRIVTYQLTADVSLVLLDSVGARCALEQEHGIDFSGVFEMKESLLDSGISGWCAPYNYPDGDDIVLTCTSILEYIATQPVESFS